VVFTAAKKILLKDHNILESSIHTDASWGMSVAEDYYDLRRKEGL